jgi:hypothetical protein
MSDDHTLFNALADRFRAMPPADLEDIDDIVEVGLEIIRDERFAGIEGARRTAVLASALYCLLAHVDLAQSAPISVGGVKLATVMTTFARLAIFATTDDDVDLPDWTEPY